MQMSGESECGSPQYVIGPIGTGERIFQRLTDQIRDRGMTWTSVAAALSISRQALSRALNADRVSYMHLKLVCDHLGVEVFEVVDRFDVAEYEKNGGHHAARY